MCEVAMPYRIIVADKDPLSLSAVSRLFESEDFHFSGVTSAGELKKTIRTFGPNLIILNSILSDTRSWQAVQKIVSGIRASKDFSGLRILLMSGDPGSPRSSELNVVGADGYLDKPIDGPAVRKAVESLLGMSQDNHLEEDEEDITLDFEDGSAGIETASAESHSQSELVPESEAHFLDASQAEAVSLVEDPGLHDIDVPSDGAVSVYEVTKEDVNLEQFPGAGSWVGNFNESLSIEPITGKTHGAKEPSSSDLEFVSDVYDSVLSTSGEAADKTSGDELCLNGIEPDPMPELDSTVPPGFTEFTSRESSVDSGFRAQRHGDIFTEARRIISDALPPRDEISLTLERHIASIMPSRDELAATFQTAIERRIHEEFTALQSSGKKIAVTNPSLSAAGQTESFLADNSLDDETTIALDVLEEPSFQAKRSPDYFDKSILERCLTDALPARDEIMALISNSIAETVVDAVEKVVREQIEKITSDLLS
jgi:DNA-binding response OmpR family regulator